MAVPRRLDLRSASIVDDVLEQVREAGFCVVETCCRHISRRASAQRWAAFCAPNGASQPSGHQRILHLLMKDAYFPNCCVIRWRSKSGASTSARTCCARRWLPRRYRRTARNSIGIRTIRIVLLHCCHCVSQEEMLLQLSRMTDPSQVVQQSLGAKRYVLTRGFSD